MGDREQSNNPQEIASPQEMASPQEIGAHLSDRDAKARHQAREQLVNLGEPVLPLLIEKLGARNWQVRWEACKALGEMQSPEAAPKAVEALVGALQDDDTSVRWAAMGSLIQIGRPSLKPLMLALTREFSSSRFRQGAHHVLHTLHNQGKLTGAETDIYRALEGVTSGIQAAELANRALITEYVEVGRK